DKYIRLEFSKSICQTARRYKNRQTCHNLYLYVEIGSAVPADKSKPPDASALNCHTANYSSSTHGERPRCAAGPSLAAPLVRANRAVPAEELAEIAWDGELRPGRRAAQAGDALAPRPGPMTQNLFCPSTNECWPTRLSTMPNSSPSTSARPVTSYPRAVSIVNR